MEVSSTNSPSRTLDSVEGTGRNKSEDRLEKSSGYDIGTQEYLDLFMEQMKNQDPQDPMKTGKMMDQTSSLVQLQNNEKMSSKIDEMSGSADRLINSINEMFSTSQRDQYISKIGEAVSVETSDGVRHTGELEKVKMQSEGTAIVVNGQSISTGDIEAIGSPDST